MIVVHKDSVSSQAVARDPGIVRQEGDWLWDRRIGRGTAPPRAFFSDGVATLGGADLSEKASRPRTAFAILASI